MEKPPYQSSIETKASPSIALPNSVSGYGRAVTIPTHAYPPPIRKETFSDKLKFLYGEYITGIFFIVAFSIYTLFVPKGIANSIKNVMPMMDKFIKKVIDYGGALTGLILALPIFLIVPILIKLDSRGPVFYTQDRVGLDRRKRTRRIYRADIDSNHRIRERRRENYNGRPFKVIKFRTMVNNAEASTGAVWATKYDNRITKLGKFLRKSRIDEVPQLLNVLKGDMSMVGPRPERPVFVQDFANKIPDYAKRLSVKPGITGLAQVTTGYDTSFDSVIDKLEHDMNYIRDWSFFSDIKILFRTVGVVVTGKGAN